MPAGELPRTIEEPGKLPGERFKDAAEVRTVAQQMITNDGRRAEWRAQIEKLWAGNPTYPQHVLKAAGQGWRARVNYRGLEGAISSEQTLDYDLETEVDTVIDIDLDYGEDVDRRDWEDSIEKNFTWMLLQRWNNYNFHIPTRIFQKQLHGMGMHIWPTLSGNWIPRTPRAGSVLFPDDCPLNFEEDGDYFVLRDFVPASSVYRWIANEKQATNQGWNVSETWKALAETSRDGGRGRDAVEAYARRMRQGDTGYSATTQAGLWLNYMFVREFESGKITQYIVSESSGSNKYLFKKRDRFEEWPLVMFPYDIGNGTIQSVRGLGARTKDFFELLNRITNSMADQVMLSAYPNIKQTVQNIDPDKLKLMKVGAMSILPYGAEPSLLKYPDLSNGPLALSRELSMTMKENNRGGMAGNQVEQSDRMTGQEFLSRSQDISRLNNGSVALQRSNLRRFYEKVLMLAVKPSSSDEPWSKMAREFRRRCERDGVPVEAFKHIVEVRANVSSGRGSAAARIQSLMALMQTVYPATSEDRKIAIERDIVSNLMGRENTDLYARNVKDNDLPDSDDSFAVQETDNLVQGGDALAAPRQNHVKHLQRHFAKAEEIGMAAEEGQMDPQQAYQAIAAIVAHGEQHLQFLQSNPAKKEEFGQLYNQWQQLQRVMAKLQALIEDQMEATPPKQEISEDMQIGLAKVEADERVKTEKMRRDDARKWRGQMFKERMQDATTATSIARQNTQAASDIRRKNVTAAADITNPTAK